MTFLDIIIIIVIALCLVRGLFRGLVREISSIVGVLAGFYGAYTYYGILSPVFQGFIATPVYREALSFFLLFVVIITVVNGVAAAIRHLLNIVFLGWADRLFGMVFGALKGILVIAVGLIGLTTFLPGGVSIAAESRLTPYVLEIADAVSGVVAGNQGREIENNLKRLGHLWNTKKSPGQTPK